MNNDCTNYPMVSCITTTYKNFKYLFQTLESIFMQDYPNIELIIGDDGSNNFPRKEIERFISENKKKNIKNVLILQATENRGTVKNCSACREVANGEYIMGLASDDRFYDEKVVSDVVDFFKKTGAEIITCLRQFVDNETEKDTILMPFPKQQKILENSPPYSLFEHLSSFCFLTGANTYYTKKFYSRMGGYNTEYKYMEDYPFYLKLLRQGERIRFFKRVTIRYRFGGGVSTTPHSDNLFRKEMYEDRIRYMTKEIIPYMTKMSWWRKEQMKVRLKRFNEEKECEPDNLFILYLKMFLYSPVGTLANLYFQGIYKTKLVYGRIIKNEK